jgi:single-strand DNA-binding protein
MARSLNKVILIGNLTRDPELRYTPQGTAVCTFGLATNRQWTTDSGEKKENAEFHRLVAWNKLAEICAQLLKKGRKIFVEGRLQTRSWQGQDGTQRSTTEVIVNDMILLDSKREDGISADSFDIPESSLPQEELPPSQEGIEPKQQPETKSVQDKKEKKEVKDKDGGSGDDIPVDDDIPF